MEKSKFNWLFYILKYLEQDNLLFHSLPMQHREMVSPPTQSAPPSDGSGFVHDLSLIFCPSKQPDCHSLHSVQPPSTDSERKWQLEFPCFIWEILIKSLLENRVGTYFDLQGKFHISKIWCHHSECKSLKLGQLITQCTCYISFSSKCSFCMGNILLLYIAFVVSTMPWFSWAPWAQLCRFSFNPRTYQVRTSEW